MSAYEQEPEEILPVIPLKGFRDLFSTVEEQIEPVDAAITGTVPDWLEGSLLRVGPGQFDLGEKFTLNHFFDGYAIIYKFEIKKNSIRFFKRYLQSDAYKRANAVKKPVFIEYGTKSFSDPGKGFLKKVMDNIIPELTDNTALGLFTINGNLYCGTQTNFLRKLDHETLETGDKVDLYKPLGVSLIAPHPFTDANGDTFTVGQSIITQQKYHIIKIPATQGTKDPFKKSTLFTNISPSWKTAMTFFHSFAITDNYIIFLEQPLVLNLVKVISLQIKGRSLKDCLDWFPDESVRFFVIDKATGKQLDTVYKSKLSIFVFHHINAYEEDNQIVLDVIAHPDATLLDKLCLERLRKNEFDGRGPGGVQRFVIPIFKNIKDAKEGKNLVTLKTTATAEREGNIIYLMQEQFAEPGYEMPCVHPKHVGKKYRFFYSTGIYDPGFYHNSVLKTDMVTQEIKIWRGLYFEFPCEPIFVPRPGGTEEDDGIILVPITDVRKEVDDYLLILNAKDMTEIVRASVKTRVPLGMHGLFIPKDKVGAGGQILNGH